jgi:Flp pilus assembly protein TadG
MTASIATAGAICAIGIAAAGLVGIGAAAAESQRASGIADAAALAAAETLAGFAAGEPCERAHRVAASQSGSVTGFGHDGLVATVTVRTRFGAIPVAAVARAGPPL